MKIQLRAAGGTLATMLLLCTGPVLAEGKGPFEAVSASDSTVWVVDTRTGQVRKCTQDFADQAPRCTAMSD
jgi:hypothetical protein